MLQAMNTGHDGSLSTGPAQGCRDMLRRIETMVLMGVELPLDAVRAQIASGIDILVHLGRLRDRSRKILDVMEVIGFEDHQIRVNPLFQFRELEEGGEYIRGCWEKVGNLQRREKLEAAGLTIDAAK